MNEKERFALLMRRVLHSILGSPDLGPDPQRKKRVSDSNKKMGQMKVKKKKWKRH
jgi:hypothetical protein